MAKIIILNGARKNGNTAKLVDAFIQGAEAAGNSIKRFDLYGMKIAGCLGCEGCARPRVRPESPCVQKDDMTQIYEAFAEAEVVVFASPIYFWAVNGVLKTATDRLYAELRCLGREGFPRKGVLLMTAAGPSYDEPVEWYRIFERYLGWTNLGMVLGADKASEAYDLGSSIH
ncbi:MAG: flavodoxin family protein [Synergistaceae bacterium]|nr:flavodoxin family protein [Synergistaceae bacterium]